MPSLLLVSFAIYAGILFCIGWISHRKEQNTQDFLMGGRKINYWVTALSAHASDMSSWLFLGLPVAVYTSGFSQLWIAFGLLCGMASTWGFVAKKLRQKTEAYGSLTLSDFFAKTLDDKSNTITLVSGLAILFFFTFYIASGLYAIGVLFDGVFAIPFVWGVVLSALMVIAYTIIGGYSTVALTDAFQAVFLLIMILLVPLVAYFYLPSSSSSAVAAPEAFSLGSTSQGLITALSWGLGYFGMPHILTKFMGINKADDIKKSMRLGLSWQFLTLSSSVAIGLIARSYFAQGLEDPEKLFIQMVQELFPVFIAGFIFCGVLAATISTIDSQVIVSASVMTKDIVNPESAKKQLLVSRLSIVGITLVGVFIALNHNQSLHEMVRYAWSGQGSTFGPLVLCCLYFKPLTKAGALSGIVTGASVSALWPMWELPLSSTPLIPGFFLSLASILVVSWLTPKKLPTN